VLGRFPPKISERLPQQLGQNQGIQGVHHSKKLLATQCKAAKVKNPKTLLC